MLRGLGGFEIAQHDAFPVPIAGLIHPHNYRSYRCGADWVIA
jgi:hypothetical protein